MAYRKVGQNKKIPVLDVPSENAVSSPTLSSAEEQRDRFEMQGDKQSSSMPSFKRQFSADRMLLEPPSPRSYSSTPKSDAPFTPIGRTMSAGNDVNKEKPHVMRPRLLSLQGYNPDSPIQWTSPYDLRRQGSIGRTGSDFRRTSTGDSGSSAGRKPEYEVSVLHSLSSSLSFPRTDAQAQSLSRLSVHAWSFELLRCSFMHFQLCISPEKNLVFHCSRTGHSSGDREPSLSLMCVGLQIGSVLWKLHAEGGGSQEHASSDSADGKGEEVLSDKPFLDITVIPIASPDTLPFTFMDADLYHCFHSWAQICTIASIHGYRFVPLRGRMSIHESQTLFPNHAGVPIWHYSKEHSGNIEKGLQHVSPIF